MELEQRVDPDERGAYPVRSPPATSCPAASWSPRSPRTCAPASTSAGSPRASTTGSPTPRSRAVVAAAGEHGVATAALSGGVFVNLVLLERVRAGLEAAGLRVLVPTRVPCTDGGISLGQVAVCAARM